MIRFKFTGPIQDGTKVIIHIGTRRYKAHVEMREIGTTIYWCIYSDRDHYGLILSLRMTCEEYFAVRKRNIKLSQLGYTYCGIEAFPYFNSSKDLERFLKYINLFYTEI